MARLARNPRLPVMPAVGKRNKFRQLINARPRNDFLGRVILGQLGNRGTLFLHGHVTSHTKVSLREACFRRGGRRLMAIRAFKRGGGDVRAMAERERLRGRGTEGRLGFALGERR